MDLGLGLGFGLECVLGFWLEFGLQFGLEFGLWFGLGFKLGFGPGFRLGFGLGFDNKICKLSRSIQNYVIKCCKIMSSNRCLDLDKTGEK